MKKRSDIPWETLITRAAAHRPDTAAAELGFETRLMARLREMRRLSEDGFLEVFSKWLWRGALGLWPGAVALALLVLFMGEESPSLGDSAHFLEQATLILWPSAS
ncbi:MAG: hypothetical protein KDM91_12775 [Verrucomicrobiae bacterium]|nr:hypothetical protein [Verrucomicrobiae bacterium]MCP5539285.1 hypothetical protein [Akkermansiaceae bacterium]